MRSLAFVFGAGLIIALAMLPGNFLGTSYAYFDLLFPWCASFTHRRPGSATPLLVLLIAIFYAIYLDEGLALGAISLLIFVSLLRKYRYSIIHQGFWIEVLITTGIYALVLISKNLVLFLMLSPQYSFLELLLFIASFVFIYPLINFIVVLLVRSKKDEVFPR